MTESQACENNTCVVCFKNVVYFSIGECDHPVCFECSTRMRVLCQQNECPICRQLLSRVVFTDSVQLYKDLRNKVFPDRLFERQYKIGFCSDDIKNAYEQLLEHRCKVCTKIPPFRTFTMLSDHMRKVHEKFFCDLCVKHLKIFTFERKCYTRQELGHHRRKGDLDDTSHRGHPLCEFCEERFMDADELYRHLRKEHLYCHLCDADGRNLYYATHQALAQHFRSDHYLCEEGECAGQHLTAVFRSEIDLKAHKATVHGKGMPRGAARQARTLELQFNITPHPVLQRAPNRREPEPAPPPPAPVAPPTPRIDTGSDEHFPRLTANPPAPTPLLPTPVRHYSGVGSLARNDKNFPALDGSGGSRPPSTTSAAPVTATVVKNSKPSVSVQLQSRGASNFRLQTTPRRNQPAPSNDDEDFPELAMRDDHPSLGASSTQPPKVALVNSQEMQSLRNGPQTNSQAKKVHLSSEAFPALSSTATPTAPPKWCTVNRGKEPPKPQPQPQPPRPAAFNPAADFPTLPANAGKARKAASVPNTSPSAAPSPRTIITNNTTKTNKQSKKEKKKQATVRLEEEDYEPPIVNGIDAMWIVRDAHVSSVNNNSSEADKKIKTLPAANPAPVPTPDQNRNSGSRFSLAAGEFPPLAAGGGLTFTNSSGETFAAPVHRYIPPPKFEERNRALAQEFAALGGAGVDRLGADFRAGRISASEFVAKCKIALKSRPQLLSELVALLPDIGKQQELAAAQAAPNLRACNRCGQLLAPKDLSTHKAAH